MRSDNTSDTGRVPSLSSSSLPPAPTSQSPAAAEDGTPTATERKIAVLGPTLRFKGDMSAEEDFILQGRVQGSIHHTQTIIIGTGGSVAGTIYARRIVIDGTVEGDLYGVESVVVHETGRVIGNIFAPRVGLVDGAVFNGRIDMTGASSASQGTNSGTSTVVAQVANQGANQVVTQVVTQGVNQGAGAPTVLKKRVETPAMSPGQPLSAEQTEKILTPPKIAVVPPPPRREGTGG